MILIVFQIILRTKRTKTDRKVDKIFLCNLKMKILAEDLRKLYSLSYTSYTSCTSYCSYTSYSLQTAKKVIMINSGFSSKKKKTWSINHFLK